MIVVGDTHGQFLDVLYMLDHTEAYDEGKMYIFNGAFFVAHLLSSPILSAYYRTPVYICSNHWAVRMPINGCPGEACEQWCESKGRHSQWFGIAGDLVDRGSWGVELFLSVAVLKLADPARYFILRGNHESSWCTKMYGFKKELDNMFPHKRRQQAGGQKLNIGSFVSAHPISFPAQDLWLGARGV